jgi:hypothetical protein
MTRKQEAPANAGVNVPGADPEAAIAETVGEFAPIPPEPEPGPDGTLAAARQVAVARAAQDRRPQ